MTYVVSITSQGQISIPVAFRRQLNLSKKNKAIVRLEDNTIILEPIEDLFDLQGFFRTERHVSSRKIREGFERYLAEEATRGTE